MDVATSSGMLVLSIFEDGVPPRFRVRRVDGAPLLASDLSVETIRPDGARQTFRFADCGGYAQSIDDIPEPHAFTAQFKIGSETYPLVFSEHEHGAHDRDNNMRSAVIHVMADATVSVLVITGLLLARWFGWVWMDPLAGIVGAMVIASWSYGLIRDTGAILLDMNPDPNLADQIRRAVEVSGDAVTDLHLWRLGPGHLGAILSIATRSDHDEAHYRARLARFPRLSHLTVEVVRPHEMSQAA